MTFLRRFRKKSPAPQNLDQALVLQLSKSRIPGLRQLKYVGKFLSSTERKIVLICLLIALIGLGFLGRAFYKNNITTIPGDGGSYVEGVIGSPQYINPLYASLNDADADLEKLIFSSLFTRDKEGRVINDLADNISVSADEKTYTIKLKKALWPNGQNVTADDVVFTFNALTNSDYKSPLRDKFSGVSIDKVDDQTIVFSLSDPYRDFTRLLDFGILSADAWESVSTDAVTLTELNIKPIGSGPYLFKTLVKSKNGTIHSYTLERNNNYYGEKGHLQEITFKFFPSAEEMIAAYNNGQINGLSYVSPDLMSTIIAKNSLDYHQIALPELTSLYFNLTTKRATSDKIVRQALAAAINQTNITNNSVGRAGMASQTLLPSFIPGNDNVFKFDFNKAGSLLDSAGWTKNGDWRVNKDNKPLTISLLATDDMKSTAEEVAKAWQALGIKVEVATHSDEVIQKDVIGNHQFEVLLYSGTIANGDPYPLWRSDSSTNITGWKRKDVDKFLDQARVVDEKTAANLYHNFLIAAADDVPAIPLFWQAYVYPQTKKLKGFNLISLEDPSERFDQATLWYLRTKYKLK